MTFKVILFSKLLLIIVLMIILPVLYLGFRISHFIKTTNIIYECKTINFHLIFYIYKILFIFLLLNLFLFLAFVELHLLILLIYFNIIY